MAEGSVVLFQGCGHNPTGSDPTDEEWRKLSKLCKVCVEDQREGGKGRLEVVDHIHLYFTGTFEEAGTFDVPGTSVSL